MSLFGGSHTQTLVLAVAGMHCDHCAANLERGLKALPGIKKVQASYAKQCATVMFDSRATNAQSIAAEIQKIGYEATLPAT